MNKEDLVRRVAESTGQSRQVTRRVLDTFLATVSDNLAEGENIEIRGFGSFKVVNRRERTARNPRTGEKVQIPSRLVPAFKPSRCLNEKVADKN